MNSLENGEETKWSTPGNDEMSEDEKGESRNERNEKKGNASIRHT